MLKRILVGVGLVAVLAALLAWDHTGGRRAGLTLLLTAATAFGMSEFYGIARRRGLHPASGPAIALAVALMSMRACAGGPVFAAAGLPELDSILLRLHARIGEDVFLTAGLLSLLLLALRPSAPASTAARVGRTIEDLSITVFGFLFVGWPLSRGLNLRSAPGTGELWILLVLVTSKASDIAAYFVGKALGRHPMAPMISPKKTWEGAAAGLMAGTLAGACVACRMAPDGGPWCGSWVAATALSAALAAAGQAGDLAESAVKRWGGVKDSGAWFGESGGVLDVVDSFLVSLPVAWLAVEIGRVFGIP